MMYIAQRDTCMKAISFMQFGYKKDRFFVGGMEEWQSFPTW